MEIIEEKYKLYNGDCLEIMDKLIEDRVKVDAIICDPPPIDEKSVVSMYNNGMSMRKISEHFNTNHKLIVWNNMKERIGEYFI